MPELSNLLRQGLSRAQNGDPLHPDADTITAYVEQSLPAAERQTVVAHLALCEPCREVVALSQPQLPEMAVQPLLQPAPVPAWRRFLTPAFGLAAAVATMAVIAVSVLQLPHNAGPQSQQQAKDQQAKVTVPADQAAEAKQSQPAPAASQNSGLQNPDQHTPALQTNSAPPPAPALDSFAPAQKMESRQRRDETSAPSSANVYTTGSAIAPAPPPVKAPVLTAGLKKDYVNTNFFANESGDVVLEEQSKNAPASPQPQNAAAARGFTVSTDKMAFSDLPASTNKSSQQRLMTPLRFGCTVCAKMAQATVHTLHMRSNNPPLRAGNLGNSALGGLGMFSSTLQKNQAVEVSAASEKTDDSSLAGSNALSIGALGGSSYAAAPDSISTVWRVAGGKLIKSSGSSWEDGYPAAGIEFSSVSSHGKDVWAGGKNAVLIHSRDGGSVWETIKLGDGVTGTIVNILAGVSTVQVKTSDNQLWLSTDGGKTWSLQQ